MMPNRLWWLPVALAVGVAGSAGAGTLFFRSDLAGTFTDISATGDALGLDDDDVVPITLTVSNAVFSGDTCWVANNGVVGFETAHAQPPVTDPIGNMNIWDGDQALVPFGDDIGNETGDVFMQTFTTPDGGGSVLIIQWHDKHFTGSTNTCRFQVKIFSDPGPDHIYAQFIYDDIQQPHPNGGQIATIGHQDGGAGFNDVQWSYHTAGAVWDGAVLSLVVPEPTTALLLCGLIPLMLRQR
ncbi:MAG: hypothetical protein KAY37_08105 [Phycisphaerae bacterium]|nr:hypothetical protein [Phycisphaerae bacterium]